MANRRICALVIESGAVLQGVVAMVAMVRRYGWVEGPSKLRLGKGR